MPISRRDVGRLIEHLIETGARRATKYSSPRFVARATRRHKPDRRNSRTEFVVTIGAPNYREREFIKLAQKAKETFPISRIQLDHKWPNTSGRRARHKKQRNDALKYRKIKIKK